MCIRDSYREAVRFKAAQIGTEHLLIAILREGDCVASRLLNTMGVRDVYKRQAREEETVRPAPVHQEVPEVREEETLPAAAM